MFIVVVRIGSALAPPGLPISVLDPDSDPAFLVNPIRIHGCDGQKLKKYDSWKKCVFFYQ
jgi:hypothetical protein